MGDSSLGKVKTILIFACTYLAGLLLLTASALPFAYDNYPNDPSKLLGFCGFFMALFLIGMGTGGLVTALHNCQNCHQPFSSIKDQIECQRSCR